ncbi:hypothetical protein BN844_0321 [Pseudomonas sp. SHC52]|nr:hypothetical protein BN844_0321 [Pseudomonas sp. SHC52]
MCWIEFFILFFRMQAAEHFNLQRIPAIPILGENNNSAFHRHRG